VLASDAMTVTVSDSDPRLICAVQPADAFGCRRHGLASRMGKSKLDQHDAGQVLPSWAAIRFPGLTTPHSSPAGLSGYR